MNPPIESPEQIVNAAPPGLLDGLSYPFFQSVFDRKSRRMALGMELEADFFDYASPYEPVPLTELEEALLLVAGTGLTGLNLGDIDPSMGADALVQWTARTWPSSCSNHGTELFFTNDDGETFVLRAGAQFELLHVNEIGEPTLASPALVDGRWYIRTDRSLIAVGRP